MKKAKMMRYISLLFTICLSVVFSTGLHSQPLEFPVHDLKFSYQIERDLAEDSIHVNRAGWYYSYIGDYANAMQLNELHAHWGYDSIELENPDQWQLADAIPYLTKKLRDERLVIISEAHHKPQHRIFTKILLDSLSKYGYNHLGLEALGNMPGYRDSLLNERGYALNSPMTGTYTREPQMANLIRKAKSLNIQVFAIGRDEPETERDTQMAMNIIEYMNARPEDKFIIQCGWHHAVESDFPKGRDRHWMAYLIKQMGGIDPVTIYQDILTEKYSQNEAPIYNQFSSDKISVLVDQEGNPFGGHENAQHVDMQVYHPRTFYINGRPNWMYLDPGFKNVNVPKEKIEFDYPVICRAILKNEYPLGVPVDIIELKSRYTGQDLVLSPGEYVIEIINKENKKMHLDLIVDE